MLLARRGNIIHDTRLTRTRAPFRSLRPCFRFCFRFRHRAGTRLDERESVFGRAFNAVGGLPCLLYTS
ncbi:MAG: hypothetical protein MPK62_11735, partial [Alphaproteobacteria bacterium]|nr:hypothetical protein [Alphaproteobacteria bacterium]